MLLDSELKIIETHRNNPPALTCVETFSYLGFACKYGRDRETRDWLMEVDGQPIGYAVSSDVAGATIREHCDAVLAHTRATTADMAADAAAVAVNCLPDLINSVCDAPDCDENAAHDFATEGRTGRVCCRHYSVYFNFAPCGCEASRPTLTDLHTELDAVCAEHQQAPWSAARERHILELTAAITSALIAAPQPPTRDALVAALDAAVTARLPIPRNTPEWHAAQAVVQAAADALTFWPDAPPYAALGDDPEFAREREMRDGLDAEHAADETDLDRARAACRACGRGDCVGVRDIQRCAEIARLLSYDKGAGTGGNPLLVIAVPADDNDPVFVTPSTQSSALVAYPAPDDPCAGLRAELLKVREQLEKAQLHIHHLSDVAQDEAGTADIKQALRKLRDERHEFGIVLQLVLDQVERGYDRLGWTQEQIRAFESIPSGLLTTDIRVSLIATIRTALKS